MSADDATPRQPEEDHAVIEPGLSDAEGLVDPVAVGPGDPGHYDATPRPDRPIDGGVPAHAGADAADEPVAPTDGAPPADDGESGAAPVGWSGTTTPGDASLLDLIDRLTAVLERSDLAELEVATGGTTIILRSPSTIAPAVMGPGAASAGASQAADGAPVDGAATSPPPVPVAAPERPSVKAPLTGIYYAAPSPGATPYLSVGNHVSVGQIIGLIEAMKLFNEIKSDLSGRVVRICAESGALVKAKQPLIEVEPA